MCGINGIITQRLSVEKLDSSLKQMNTAIHHRGPDDNGVFVMEKNGTTIGFGHVRLSILDLSPLGHQPMFYHPDKGSEVEEKDMLVSITLNGEVYNYQELRNELALKGYYFSSKTDTEVVLASYLEWGEDCIHHFNGFWSFALFDREKNIVFCSRDRIGKKPFFYADGEDFIFSSEIHPIASLLPSTTINQDAIDFFLTGRFIPSPLTIYNEIHKLPAGHNLTYDISTRKIVISKYYYLPKYNPEYDKKKLLEEGRAILEDAVNIRLRSDVPVGVYLSGGLDSACIAYFTKKKIPQLRSFSSGFEGTRDETKNAQKSSELLGTNHTSTPFAKSDFLDSIDTVLASCGEPFADIAIFPNYLLAKRAKKEISVVLTGDGADELFGGYHIHSLARWTELSKKYIPRIFRNLLVKFSHSSENNLSRYSRVREALRLSLLPKEDFFAEMWSEQIIKTEKYKIWCREKMKEVLENTNGNLTQAAMDFDLLYNTIPDNFLTRIDRANMLAGVETRSPFLDYRLIEYSRRIPSGWKIPVRERKDFLKNLLKPYLAKEILTRKKGGYTPPIYEWIEEIMGVAKNSYSSLGKIRLTREYILERFIELYRK